MILMKYIVVVISCAVLFSGCKDYISELENKILYTKEGCAYIIDPNPLKSCTDLRFLPEQSKSECPKLDKKD